MQTVSKAVYIVVIIQSSSSPMQHFSLAQPLISIYYLCMCTDEPSMVTIITPISDYMLFHYQTT